LKQEKKLAELQKLIQNQNKKIEIKDYDTKTPADIKL